MKIASTTTILSRAFAIALISLMVLVVAAQELNGDDLRKIVLAEGSIATCGTRPLMGLEQTHRYDKAEGELHDARLPEGRLLIAQGTYRP